MLGQVSLISWKIYSFAIVSGIGALAVLVGALADSGLDGMGEYLKIGLAAGGIIGGILVALVGGKVIKMGNELTNASGGTIRSKIEDIAGETKGVRNELREIDHRLVRVEERMRIAQGRGQDRDQGKDREPK